MELTTGRCAMIVNGAWIGGELTDGFSEDEELIPVFFPVVEGKGTGPVIEAKYNGWHIPQDAKHVDATVHFFKFMTSRAIQERKVSDTDSFGILKGLAEPKHGRNQAHMMATASKIVGMHHSVQDEIPEWLTNVYIPVDDRFFFGEIGAEEFIQELQRAHDAYWATKE
jgi:ABC-type glycerol-3-phosphate transport system substrate-binding protein